MIFETLSNALMLAQNAMEKDLTKLGLAFFAAFMFFLIMDSTIKSRYVPKSKAVVGLLVFLFVATIIALIVLFIYYK